MTLRACTVCGEVSEGSRCDAHQRKDLRRHRSRIRSGRDPQWRLMSYRLRKRSPFCQYCNATVDLTVDHIIPVSERPDLSHNTANCQVLCRSCNSRRGTNCTDAERASVLAVLAERKMRRRTGGGMTPDDSPALRRPRQNLRYTPRGGMR